jgi:HEAT repeat protein
MLQDQEAGCRETAAKTLGLWQLPNRTMVDALISAVNDSEPGVRLAAIRSLGQAGVQGGPAVYVLSACLSNDLASARAEAARSLGAIGGPAKAALPDLLRLGNDKENSVRAAAMAAITRIETVKAAKTESSNSNQDN